MRVVVTRPQGQAQPLIQAIEQQGVETVALPLLEIKPFSPQASEARVIVEKIQHLHHYQHLIFVSTNAIDCAFDWIERILPAVPTGLRWYPIGQASAQRLADYAVQAEQSGVNMDSEGLLANAHLQQLTGQKVLIFRGQGGRMLLHDELTRRGAQVEFCELYQRKNIAYAVGTLKRLLADKVDSFIASSVQTVQALLQQAEKEQAQAELLSTALIVPGQRVANYAKSAGFSQVFASQNAGTAAIIKTLNSIR